ncbi:MAG TPA: peroxidase family protein, partial [Dehalococcoidia bacterium]|nr:peroxidase family protein [Dehalococcoidia bacterium]
MSQSSGKKLLTTIGLIGVGVAAGLLLAEAMKSRREQSAIRGVSPLSRLLGQKTYFLDRVVPWHKQPLPLGVLGLIGMRARLRDENLHNTNIIPSTIQPVPESKDRRYLTARSPDGTYNDLTDPLMGAIGTRFGRNAPFSQSFPEKRPALMEPSPREVSRKLLAREQFIPASTLNLMAGAWLQFMIHDWFSHGKNDKNNHIRIPLNADDPWPHGNPMTFLGTTKDPTRPAGSQDYPPTFLNAETHWWDGSQLYGTSQEILNKVRSGEQGKLKIGSDGLLLVDEHGIDITGVTGNYWIGLSMLHTLFVREHNAICDHLRDKHPDWSDDQLFDHARLINSALMAKI